jgi:cell shape-determining protein MreC
VLTGGGALLKNLDVLLREETGLPVMVCDDPISAVVLGSGKALDHLELLKEVTIYAARIEYLERTDEIRVGDDVYTSGLGHRFPASILVGRVTEVRRREFGLYQQAEVTPSVDFSALEEVLILTSGSREQTADERSADVPELDLEAPR